MLKTAIISAAMHGGVTLKLNRDGTASLVNFKGGRAATLGSYGEAQSLMLSVTNWLRFNGKA